VAYVILVAAAAYLFREYLLAAIRAGVGAIFYVLVCILGICILPLFLVWFFGFAYWFARPYFRAWHIRHIRSNRLLKEAAARGRTDR